MTDLFTKIPKINRYFIPDTKNETEDEFGYDWAAQDCRKISEKSRRATKKGKGSKGKHTTEVHFDFFQFHEKLKYDEF